MSVIQNQLDMKDVTKRYKKRSIWAEVWRNFKKNKGAIAGIITIIVVLSACIVAEFIYDYDTDIVKQNFEQRLQKPSWKHPFGTDQYGRDIFARILYGGRYSFSVGVVAVMIAFSIGSTLGIVAGYYGGVIENIIMRITDVFASIPSVLLAIAITAAFGQSLLVLMFAVGVVGVPAFCRVARAAVMTVAGQEYVEAAYAAGAKNWQILIRHIVPNSMAPIIVQCTMRVAQAIITAAGLSFLGLGVPTPSPEWGGMLSDGRAYIRDYSYMTMFPGLAIMITVLAINLIGDGLRDAMDPKLKR
jgi:peptide/nickel transport system permease protein